SVRKAACRHSTLVIMAPERRGVRIWMVERVQRAARRDLEVEAEAGVDVPNRDLEVPVPRVPQEEDLVASAQPLGQFPRSRFASHAPEDTGAGDLFRGYAEISTSSANAAGSSVRESSRSFRKTLVRWPSTVRSVTNSCWAISRLVRLCPASSATRRSLAVSESSPVRTTLRGRAPVARRSVSA